MESMIIIVHVVVAIAITGLVLIQQGKGADMGASFGSGASQTIFGSTGTGNVLSKSTSWLAVIFFATSLGLALLARQQAGQGVDQGSLIQNLDQLEMLRSTTPAQDIPQVPAAASDLPQAPDQDSEMAAAIAELQASLEAESAGDAEATGDNSTVDEAAGQ
jgi:preprotein translocase subunit SecG